MNGKAESAGYFRTTERRFGPGKVMKREMAGGQQNALAYSPRFLAPRMEKGERPFLHLTNKLPKCSINSRDNAISRC